MAQFSEDIKRWILQTEGGYVDDPRDPGGATNMGITFRTLKAWRGQDITKDDVRNLTSREALQIYKKNYWDAIRGDQLPVGVDYAIFDYAVNSGVARAVKDVQRVLGVGVDGILGVVTLEAINNANPTNLINKLQDRRQAFLEGLSTFKVYGNGWSTRVREVRQKALALVSGASTDMPNSVASGEASSQAPSITDVVFKSPEGLAGGLGGVAAIFSAITNQPILQVAVVALIAFVVWKVVSSKRKADPN